ncbi:hypothetical protein NDU88_004276 [Pleurodeles waltl]|uniref:Uncharacterized protein n=1 Tax=Pleurodeles waltl TaxID=8319 RepID=A0AAV7VGL6_PLEWA|nr:hypothetical protein NDU88_004276 [Pleurodeles waltl]
MVANRCSCDLMMLKVETAKEVVQTLLSKMQALENKIRQSSALEEAKKKLKEIDKEVTSYTDYLAKRKPEKLKKDVRFTTKERTYL